MPAKKISLYSASGLCNRLRLMAYWRSIGELSIIWPKNYACPAWWSELFQDVNGVEVINTNSRRTAISRHPKSRARAFNLNDLRPVFDIPTVGQDYTAVHVRRTDIVRVHRKYGIQSPSDSSFFDFIDKAGLEKVYLATDNQKTQRIFRQRYGERLLVHGDIRGFGSIRTPKRCTSSMHAVVDLYACVRANRFMGTDCSSFTGEILAARS